MSSPNAVLHFWFDELTPQQWFNTFTDVDDAIRERFGKTHQAATEGALFEWRKTPHGRLAEIIVLDQFSRNLFREDARSFAFDTVALVLAQEAIAAGAEEAQNSQQLRPTFGGAGGVAGSSGFEVAIANSNELRSVKHGVERTISVAASVRCVDLSDRNILCLAAHAKKDGNVRVFY